MALRLRMPQARTDALLRARRHLSDLLLDQIPVLRGLRRVLDDMAAGWGPADGGSGALLLEQARQPWREYVSAM